MVPGSRTPVRSAWIEIATSPRLRSATSSRTPQEVRGLKRHNAPPRPAAYRPRPGAESCYKKAACKPFGLQAAFSFIEILLHPVSGQNHAENSLPKGVILRAVIPAARNFMKRDNPVLFIQPCLEPDVCFLQHAAAPFLARRFRMLCGPDVSCLHRSESPSPSDSTPFPVLRYTPDR